MGNPMLMWTLMMLADQQSLGKWCAIEKEEQHCEICAVTIVIYLHHANNTDLHMADYRPFL